MLKPPLRLVLIILILTISCSREIETKKVLARIGDREITVSAFKRAYIPILLYTEKTDTPETRAEILNYLLEQKILAQAGEELELDTLAILSTLARTTEKSAMRRMLYGEWVRKQLDTIPEADIRQAFRRSQEQRLVKHLFTKSKAEADSLHDLLISGNATFDQLAGELFTDSSLAVSGGTLGWMTFGEMDPDFEAGTYSLNPGEISEPLASQYGYHIIQVDDVRRQMLLTESDYALARESIRRILRQRQETRLSQDIITKFMADARLEYDEEIARRVWREIVIRINVIMGSNTLDESPNLTEVGTLQVDLADILDAPMLSFADETWTVADYLQRLPEMNRQLLVQDLETGTSYLVRDELLLEQGRAQGYNQLPEVIEEIADRQDQFLATAYLQQRAENMVLSEVQLREYYRQNSATKYLEADSLRLYELLVADETTAQEIKAQFDGGRSFTDLANQYNKKGQGKNGELGWHHPRTPINSIYYSQLVNQPIRTIVGPIKVPDGFAYISAGERRRNSLPYEAVTDEVYQDLYNDRLRKLRFHELEQLKSRYDYFIDTELLFSLDLFN